MMFVLKRLAHGGFGVGVLGEEFGVELGGADEVVGVGEGAGAAAEAARMPWS
ncbi:hypothetical protein ACQEVM_37410 [Streptomyces sp. CA-243310]|uniref:hypothetical protein n=1 Tax=Streptomyces sp. CA-243310 TaxID=3240056 RepID=UPI003D919600